MREFFEEHGLDAADFGPGNEKDPGDVYYNRSDYPAVGLQYDLDNANEYFAGLRVSALTTDAREVRKVADYVLRALSNVER